MAVSTSTTPLGGTNQAKSLLASPAPIITKTPIDFSQTPLPDYTGLYATILDNVLTPSECTSLLSLAESTGAWERAMVNIGNGRQALYTETRSCGRIIWDEPSIVEQIWQRVKPHVPEITRLENVPKITGGGPAKRGEVWRATRLNERMRFLKYEGGEYFRIHQDGTYETPDRTERTYYTLHLYLNDGDVDLPNQRLVKGGSTRFWDLREKGFVDVVPKVGRVLLFQHRGLLHSGEDVEEGTKYTMRTDLLFERENNRDSTFLSPWKSINMLVNARYAPPIAVSTHNIKSIRHHAFNSIALALRHECYMRLSKAAARRRMGQAKRVGSQAGISGLYLKARGITKARVTGSV